MQLLDAGAEALAGQFAAAEGDQRMGELVALALRIDRVPGMQKGEDALAAPGAGKNHRAEGAQQHPERHDEHPEVDAAEKKHAERHHRDDDEGAHVRLGQQQQACEGQRQRHRPHRLEEALFHVHLAHHVAGGVGGHRQLGEFAGLEVQHHELQPAPGAVDRLAQERQREQHQRQQHEREDEDRRRGVLPGLNRQAHHEQRGDQADGDRQRVARQVVRRRQRRMLGAVGYRDRGRIDHHQPERQQAEHDGDQRAVEVEQLRRPAAEDIDPVAHRQHGTALGPRGFAAGRTRAEQRPEAAEAAESEAAGRCAHACTSPDTAAKACTAATKTSARCR